MVFPHSWISPWGASYGKNSLVVHTVMEGSFHKEQSGLVMVSMVFSHSRIQPVEKDPLWCIVVVDMAFLHHHIHN